MGLKSEFYSMTKDELVDHCEESVSTIQYLTDENRILGLEKEILQIEKLMMVCPDLKNLLPHESYDMLLGIINDAHVDKKESLSKLKEVSEKNKQQRINGTDT